MNKAEKAVMFIDKYIWVFHVSVLALFVCLGVKELLHIDQKVIDKRVNHTSYRATINDTVVVCAVVEHSKLGYNMTKCENGRQYFNVSNIEMVAGER